MCLLFVDCFILASNEIKEVSANLPFYIDCLMNYYVVMLLISQKNQAIQSSICIEILSFLGI